MLESADRPVAIRLRESPQAPGLGEDSEITSILGFGAEGRLLCRKCGEPVTAEEYRIEVDGRHVHQRTNPAGVEFEFGCFGEAPGAIAVGKATTEATWFVDRSWRYAACLYCGEHLGWVYEGEGERFFGLILDRLRQEKSSTGDG